MFGAALGGAAAGASSAFARDRQHAGGVLAQDNEVPNDPDPFDFMPDSESEEDNSGPRARMAHIVSTNKFQYASASIIIVNVLAMVVMADYPDWEYWKALNKVFLGFFTVELACRIFAYRSSFLCPRRQVKASSSEPVAEPDDLNWNRFDFTIVSIGWFDYMLKLVGDESSAGQFILVIRVVRLLRVLRILRIFKAFRPLTNLIHGLMDSLVSVFWVMIFLIMVMLLFAIFTTTQFGRRASEYSNPDAIEDKWGTCWKSFSTLFSYLTLDDWSNMTREVAWAGPGNPNPPLVCAFHMFMLIVYVVLTAFVIVSVLTGTMAEQMEQVAKFNEVEADEENRQKIHDKADKFFNHYLESYNESDNVEAAGLSLEEFSRLFYNEDFQEDLAAVGVEAKIYDPRDLFLAFDYHQTGVISWDEFTQGLLTLVAKSTSRKEFFLLTATMGALELAHRRDNRPVHETVGSVDSTKEATVNAATRQINCVHKHTQILKRELDDTLHLLRAAAKKKKKH